MDQTEKSASETPTFGYRHLTNEEYIRQKRESNAAVANFLKETFPSEPYRRRRSGYRRVADAFVLFAIVMLFAAFFLLNNFTFPRFACPVVDAVASTPFAFSHGCASSLVRDLSAAYQRGIHCVLFNSHKSMLLYSHLLPTSTSLFLSGFSPLCSFSPSGQHWR